MLFLALGVRLSQLLNSHCIADFLVWLAWHMLEHKAFYYTGKECAMLFYLFSLSLSISLTTTYTSSVYSETFRNIHFHESAKALHLIPTEYFLYILSSLNFYKICMVGVKENHSNCTILLTPKSNFFCLVYLDFSVCFIVKQPTRVVVHKTAFES